MLGSDPAAAGTRNLLATVATMIPDALVPTWTQTTADFNVECRDRFATSSDRSDSADQSHDTLISNNESTPYHVKDTGVDCITLGSALHDEKQVLAPVENRCSPGVCLENAQELSREKRRLQGLSIKLSKGCNVKDDKLHSAPIDTAQNSQFCQEVCIGKSDHDTSQQDEELVLRLMQMANTAACSSGFSDKTSDHKSSLEDNISFEEVPKIIETVFCHCDEDVARDVETNQVLKSLQPSNEGACVDLPPAAKVARTHTPTQSTDGFSESDNVTAQADAMCPRGAGLGGCCGLCTKTRSGSSATAVREAFRRCGATYAPFTVICQFSTSHKLFKSRAVTCTGGTVVSTVELLEYILNHGGWEKVRMGSDVGRLVLLNHFGWNYLNYGPTSQSAIDKVFAWSVKSFTIQIFTRLEKEHASLYFSRIHARK